MRDAPTAAGLAAHLQTVRRFPVVVATVAAGQSEPYIDVADVAAAVHGLAEVYVLANGPATWAFGAALPAGTQVYGGAARVYAVDLSWLSDPFRSPLHFGSGPAGRSAMTEAIVSDALTCAHAAGLTRATEVRATAHEAAGTVIGVAGGRALVQLEHRTNFPAAIRPELLAENVPAERLFVKDMRVEGIYDPTQNLLNVAGMTLSAEEALARYAAGTTALVRAVHVERELCVVEIFPGLQVTISAAAVLQDAELTDVRNVLSVGEVLPALVVSDGDSVDDFILDLSRGVDADPLEAPPLLRGGPPWLVPPPPALAEDVLPDVQDTAGSVAVIPLADEDPQVAALRQERDQLLAELRRAEGRALRSRKTVAGLKTDLRAAKERAATSRKELESARHRLASRTMLADEACFADPPDQLRFDVWVTWAHRTLPGEKAAWPLREWQVGDHFFTSWAEVGRLERSKLVDVVVDVLTGRVEQMPARQLHQLREGAGGNDKPVVRPDGATCWRVALQQQTPAARRLHFWRLKDGSVELSSVRLHDNMAP